MHCKFYSSDQLDQNIINDYTIFFRIIFVALAFSIWFPSQVVIGLQGKKIVLNKINQAQY